MPRTAYVDVIGMTRPDTTTSLPKGAVQSERIGRRAASWSRRIHQGKSRTWARIGVGGTAADDRNVEGRKGKARSQERATCAAHYFWHARIRERTWPKR